MSRENSYVNKHDNSTLLSLHSSEVNFGLLLLSISLFCLGTWPTVMRLCSLESDSNDYNNNNIISEQNEEHRNYSNQRQSPGIFGKLSYIKTKFGQNRHPCHVYLDYAISYVLFSTLILPLTFLVITSISKATATNPDTDNNFYNVDQVYSQVDQESNMIETQITESKIFMWDQLPLIVIAMIGGSLLAIGNMTMQWSTSVYHAPLTTVLALQGSTCVVVGTYWNYLLQPEKIAEPSLLIKGVILFLCAILFSITAQRIYVLQSNKRDDMVDDKHSPTSIIKESDSKIEDYESDYFKAYQRYNSEGGISLHQYPNLKQPISSSTLITNESEFMHQTPMTS